MISRKNPFKYKKFKSEIILLCVRWYLGYGLTYRDLIEMMAERGLSMVHPTPMRWVHQYAPELDKRTRPHLKKTGDSWKVDVTYIKVKGQWMYLYRAVDKEGATIDFIFQPIGISLPLQGFLKKLLALIIIQSHESSTLIRMLHILQL